MSTISEVTSALTSGFIKMQEETVQGLINASTGNDNPVTSSKRNSTVTPAQDVNMEQGMRVND